LLLGQVADEGLEDRRPGEGLGALRRKERNVIALQRFCSPRRRAITLPTLTRLCQAALDREVGSSKPNATEFLGRDDSDHRVGLRGSLWLAAYEAMMLFVLGEQLGREVRQQSFTT